ncbi:MAG: hypothetical protein H6978_01535 [Gammaproteobacteria bacterium]|nr:hypothetical protein [Gammaproteobacteria bacterium]
MYTMHCCRFVVALTATAMLSFTTVASAQPAAGDREFQITGGFFLSHGDAWTGTAQGDLTYSLYASETLEYGGRQLVSYSINDPQEDVWTGSTTGFVNYYPWSANSESKWRTYVGLFAGAAYSDVDITGTAGPAIGFKYYFRDDVYFTTQYRVEVYFDNLDAGEETTDFQDANHVLTFGVGFKFK